MANRFVVDYFRLAVETVNRIVYTPTKVNYLAAMEEAQKICMKVETSDANFDEELYPDTVLGKAIYTCFCPPEMMERFRHIPDTRGTEVPTEDETNWYDDYWKYVVEPFEARFGFGDASWIKYKQRVAGKAGAAHVAALNISSWLKNVLDEPDVMSRRWMINRCIGLADFLRRCRLIEPWYDDSVLRTNAEAIDILALAMIETRSDRVKERLNQVINYLRGDDNAGDVFNKYYGFDRNAKDK